MMVCSFFAQGRMEGHEAQDQFLVASGYSLSVAQSAGMNARNARLFHRTMKRIRVCDSITIRNCSIPHS